MRSYHMNTETVRLTLEQRHWPQGHVADQLGVSRPHWSAVLNGHAPLSAKLRRRILDSPIFEGLTEQDLWTFTEKIEISQKGDR